MKSFRAHGQLTLNMDRVIAIWQQSTKGKSVMDTC